MKGSTVIYESAYLAINYLPTIEQKWEAISGLLEYGFYDIIPESENPLINMVYVQAIPSMKSATERYNKAVENGSKGGRKQTINRDAVYDLKSQGYTHQQIADKLGCSINSIKSIFRREGALGVQKGAKSVCNHECNHNFKKNDSKKVIENNENLIEGAKGANLSVSVSVSDTVSDSVSVTKREEIANAQKRTIEDLTREEGDDICARLNKHESYISIANLYNLEYLSKDFPKQWKKELSDRSYILEQQVELEKMKNEPQIDYNRLAKNPPKQETDISDIIDNMFK